TPKSYKSYSALAGYYANNNPDDKALDKVIALLKQSVAILENPPLRPEQKPARPYLKLGWAYRKKASFAGRNGDKEKQKHLNWESLGWLERAAVIELTRSSITEEKMRREGVTPITPLGDPALYGELGRTQLQLEQYSQAEDSFIRMRRRTPRAPEPCLL